jgi:hypothetical protein
MHWEEQDRWAYWECEHGVKHDPRDHPRERCEACAWEWWKREEENRGSEDA